jgi:hypothetical protein
MTPRWRTAAACNCAPQTQTAAQSLGLNKKEEEGKKVGK